MLFTRDLRLRDHPALRAAHDAADTIVPLFVLDDDVLGTWHGNPNRVAFLLESLADLRAGLREVDGDLVLRRGDAVEQVAALAQEFGASSVHLSADVSGFAAQRSERLRERLAGLDGTDVELVEHPGITVVAPGAVRPTSGEFFKVFTPYHRKWSQVTWREILRRPRRLELPAGIDTGELPELSEVCRGEPAPERMPGGESEGLERLKRWAASSLEHYEERHDDLAADDTSRISPYLHFGCLSPLEVASRLDGRPGAAAFLRQLAWRDFYHQVLAARPETAHEDYRSRNDVWRTDDDDLDAWRQGRTGYPLVDAAMRQLLREGFVHNRARMVVASFLTKDLYLDWRPGAAHFMDHLVDGDVANNQLNWQWTAGTGSDTNPNRVFNPTVQSTRFDATGDYIRRYVPELADVEAPEIHDPDPATRDRTGYPAPIVDHREAIEAYRAAVAANRG